ncbi:major facilitator superfamily domain-containing protein [Podospora appendiculata]|uniref:Major facilitator superfamily domain-containing protein n=1 Tax=Podospora appendiculata TaxID=314037 RepID=A0AAE0XFD9_9PEZI|nr:major facilitator superfamily domain-containing protein [Podospora appendiculata]
MAIAGAGVVDDPEAPLVRRNHDGSSYGAVSLRHSGSECATLLSGHSNGSGGDNNGIHHNNGVDEAEDDEDDDEVQDGVRQIEAVSRAWTKGGLLVAYMSILLMAFTTSLEGQVTYALAAFAVSSFNNHSLLSTVYVVQGVVNAVIKPPMAKIADVFGRLEAFTISILLCVVGYILMASSQNVETYASAQIFYSAGSTGLQILQQVFIADTSDFLNRALFSSLPDSPFLVTVWIGPAIAAAILAHSSWRWGYGMWALILPVAFLPLALSLFLNGQKAKRQGLLTRRKHHTSSTSTSTSTSTTTTATKAKASTLFNDLDVVGTLLLSAGLALILIPLTLVSRSPNGWHDVKILSMIALGILLLGLFPVWESNPRLAPHPLLPLSLLKSRSFCAGCGVGFVYFMVFYIAVQPYFYSYLLVALNLPVSRAGPITQTFSFASTIAAILASLAIKNYAPRPRPFIVAGAALYILAIALLLYTRTQAASVPSLFAAQTTLGAGAGLMHVATQLAVQASCGTNHAHVGVATAAFLTIVEVGAAVGAAISGAVWGRLVPAKLLAYLPDSAKADAAKIYASVVVARSYPWGSPEREAIGRAYQETITVLLRIALVLSLPLVGLALGVREYRLDGMGRVGGLVIGSGDGEGEGEQGVVKGSKWWKRWGWSKPRGDGVDGL